MAEEVYYSADGNIAEAPTATDSFTKVYDRDDTGAKFAARFPLHDESRHYVKFWIHVDETSSILKESGVETLGYVNSSEQNRLNRGLTSADNLAAAGAIAGAVIGATTAVKRSNIDSFRAKKSGGVSQSATQVTAAAVGGAAVGAGAGYVVTGIVTEKFKLTKRLMKLKNTIDLYTPAGINAQYNMQWDMTDDMLISLAQSDTFDSIKKAMNAPGNMFDTMGAVGSTVLNGAIGVGQIAAVGGSSTVSNLSRTALNPRKDVLFKNVENRQFQYEFQFAARSQEEAKMIDYIIFLFKIYSHPEIMEGYGQFLSIYPAEFGIEYYFINDEGKHVINPYLNRISSCVCTGINVSYASNGSYQSLMNGEPTIVNLSLRFKEIETLHQDRIRQGY